MAPACLARLWSRNSVCVERLAPMHSPSSPPKSALPFAAQCGQIAISMKALLRFKRCSLTTIKAPDALTSTSPRLPQADDAKRGPAAPAPWWEQTPILEVVSPIFVANRLPARYRQAES